jgi:hypothetical protein
MLKLRNHAKECETLRLGSAVATPLDKSSEKKVNRTAFAEEHVDCLEAGLVQSDRISHIDTVISHIDMFISWSSFISILSHSVSTLPS